MDGLDKRSAANVKNIMRLVRTKNWDWVMVLDGDERVGKTDLGALVLIEAQPSVKRAIECEDWEKSLRPIAWEFDGLMNLVRDLPKGTALVYGEASILGREAMKEYNLRFVRIMATVGLENRLYIFTWPDFWMMDPYLRDGRCRTRGFVTSSRGERGYGTWYIRKRYPFPRPGGETVWWQPAFDFRFPAVYSMGKSFAEWWARYEEREKTAKRKILEGASPDVRRELAVNLHREGMGILDIAKRVGRSHGVVGLWTKADDEMRGVKSFRGKRPK